MRKNQRAKKLILINLILFPLLMFSHNSLAASWNPMTSGTTYDLRNVWGTSETDVYAVGYDNTLNDGTILHYAGDEWMTIDSSSIEVSKKLAGVWGSSDTDIFAVGESGTILHYEYASDEWLSMDSGTTTYLENIWGTSSTDVFAVGYKGAILHYDGTDWSPMTSNTTTHLTSVWGTSSSNVYAVGYDGIHHYDGSNWSIDFPSGLYLMDIWGSSESDVFAVGLYGILYYNGTVWSAMTSGTSKPLIGVWGTSSTDVFAVGYSGTILYYDGDGDNDDTPDEIWEPMTSGEIVNNLYSPWGTTGTNIYIVGQNGTILHYGCDNNSDCSDPTPFCDTSTNICKAGCSEDTECGFCEKCEGGLCVLQADTEDSKGECSDTECYSGFCDGAGACGLEPDGASCNDDFFCTDVDICTAGKCVGSGNPCPSNSTCSEVTDTCLDPPPLTTYTIAISPASSTVESEETIQFEATTRYGGSDVPGTYSFEIIDDGGIGSSIVDGLYTAGINDTPSDITEIIKVTDTDHAVTDIARVMVITEGCEVVISPDTAAVKSFGTFQFTAQTICNGEEVPGTYQWKVTTTIESSIDETTGLYLAGYNDTDSEVTDTLVVIDTENKVTNTTSVTIQAPSPLPPMCNITLESSSPTTLGPGESITITASTEGDDCVESDYTWHIDTDIHSQITTGGSECFYRAGTNETGMLLTDTITAIDHANGISTKVTITVLYGRIFKIFPNVLLASRWTPLPHIIFIVTENIRFNAASSLTFSPDDSITTIGHIRLGNNLRGNYLIAALLMIGPNTKERFVDLHLTTVNGAGQEATFIKEKAFHIGTLPRALDESENKPE